MDVVLIAGASLVLLIALILVQSSAARSIAVRIGADCSNAHDG
jgi:hypothetical protein